MPAPSPSEIAPPETPAAPPLPPPPRPGGKPAWMRHPLFRFGSSVKLAVVLLAVVILASIAGTLYETSFDSRVARAYVYQAWWFNGWLVILCLNLACSAFSRWPWKRHHTGFLLTHLGIIVLLVGAMVGRRYGIEGTMEIFKGRPPDNQLEVHDERVLRIEDGNDGRGEVRQYPVEIISRHPSAAHPWRLGQTAGGWDLSLVDYAPALEASFEPRQVPTGADAVPGVGQPAVRVRLSSKRLKQTTEQWLLVADQEHGALDLGLASVQVRPGVAPAVERVAKTPSAPAPKGLPVDEGIFAFALQPDAPVAGPIAEGTKPSGVKVRLKVDGGGKPTVYLDWQGATWDFDPLAERGKDQDLGGSGLIATVDQYWPDFVIGKDNQPANASDQPHNPAVLVRIHGALPADDSAVSPSAGTAPNIGTAADNQATVYCDGAGTLTFLLKSSALPEPMRGTLQPGQPINTGWADWQLEALQTVPAALAHTEFRPVKDLPTTDDKSATSGDPNLVKGGGGSNDAGPQAANNPAPNRFEGIRVRLTRGGTTLEQWAASGWEFTLPTAPRPTKLSYDFRVEPLPIGLQLDAFQVKFMEGTDTPESFKSDLRVTDAEGETGTGSCSMNHPFNFPSHWWNTFTGLTYKISQASWSPQNRDMSIVQVLRDPGWLPKWVGSLVICAGIFMLFYLRPPQRGPSK